MKPQYFEVHEKYCLNEITLKYLKEKGNSKYYYKNNSS